MGTLQFIDSLVGRLAWPIVALALGLVFRRPLTQLLGRLNKIRWGEKEAELTGIAEATSDMQNAVEEAASPLPDGQESEEKRRERIERLMRDAAKWGFRLGGLGLNPMPEIGIRWTGDAPKVVISRAPEDIPFGAWHELDDAERERFFAANPELRTVYEKIGHLAGRRDD